jgi:hypothetical protein
MSSNWLHGGSGDLSTDLSWTNRPNMSGSEASEVLQDIWAATLMAA